jgi:putative flippase GtrA
MPARRIIDTSPLPSEEGGRFLRFAVVGGSNLVVALVVYAAALALGAGYILAAGLGYGAGMLNGYTWNRRWTFKAGAFHLPEFSRYVAVTAAGFGANAAGLALLIEVIGMNKLLAELVALVPVVCATFLLNRYWTFGPRTGSAASGASETTDT